MSDDWTNRQPSEVDQAHYPGYMAQPSPWDWGMPWQGSWIVEQIGLLQAERDAALAVVKRVRAVVVSVEQQAPWSPPGVTKPRRQWVDVAAIRAALDGTQ